MSLVTDSWPPTYQLRISKRAKHVRLSIKRGHGLEIAVPPRFNKRHLPQVLDRHRDWIERHIDQIKQQPLNATLPEQIHLLAVNEAWQVHYQAAKRVSVQFTSHDHQLLLLSGNIEDKKACQQALRLWLRQRAEGILLPMLAELSTQQQLPYNSARIGQQKTRWGSCSKHKSINLNANLLFLPEHLVTHTLLHELCHTVHLNHSSRFWTLLAQHDNNTPEHKKILRKANHYLPEWLEMPLC